MSVDLAKYHNSNNYLPDVGIKQTFFRSDNRLNRKRYLKREFVIFLINILCSLFMDTGNEFLTILAVVFALVCMYSSIVLSIRRLHDCDKSGYWYLLMFIPILNIFGWLYMLFQPGTNGENKYGPNPLG